MQMLNHRARGLVPSAFGGAAVRADTSDAQRILAELKQTFEAFKAEREEEIKGINAKFADVVQTEKVDRINADLTKLTGALDDINAQLAALKVGGDGKAKGETPEQSAHREAFSRYFKKGVDADLRDLEVKAALSSDSDPDGGYTVPTQEETEIDRVLANVSAMRGLARVMTISTGTYKKLVNVGGAGSGWVGERDARSQTNSPTLKELAFNAMELYANPAATQSLLDDSRLDIGAWLGEEVSIEFAEQEGDAFINGNGINKPRGILGYDKVADASYEWGKLGFIASGVAADISDSTHNGVDALLSMVYALKKGYRQGASWLMNRALLGKVRKLKDENGQFLWQPPVTAGEPATLLGYGCDDDDNMPDVGVNAYPIAFGNYRRGYLIVDRAGIRVLRDPFTNKPYVHFYTTKRVGGGVQNFEAIKLMKCST